MIVGGVLAGVPVIQRLHGHAPRGPLTQAFELGCLTLGVALYAWGMKLQRERSRGP